jgi:hypothetical protein
MAPTLGSRQCFFDLARRQQSGKQVLAALLDTANNRFLSSEGTPTPLTRRVASMKLKDALLADILEHPDDDTPRLVYADWLDDHTG